MKLSRMLQTLSIFCSSFHTKWSLYGNFGFSLPHTSRGGFGVFFWLLWLCSIQQGPGMSPTQWPPSSVSIYCNSWWRLNFFFPSLNLWLYCSRVIKLVCVGGKVAFSYVSFIESCFKTGVRKLINYLLQTTIRTVTCTECLPGVKISLFFLERLKTDGWFCSKSMNPKVSRRCSRCPKPFFPNVNPEHISLERN